MYETDQFYSLYNYLQSILCSKKIALERDIVYENIAVFN